MINSLTIIRAVEPTIAKNLRKELVVHTGKATGSLEEPTAKGERPSSSVT
jgi:hypothetical protein